MIYAHTLKDCPVSEWEPLYGDNGHAVKTAALLESFPCPFVPGVLPDKLPVWRVLGLYHDMGKGSPAFQRYLQRSSEGKPAASVDHKTAAARWWWNGEELNPLAIMLAYAFTGHHGGLKYGVELFGDAYKAGEGMYLKESADALPPELCRRQQPGMPQVPARSPQECMFMLSFMARMLHSALVDADWLATESFVEPLCSRKRTTIPFESLARLSEGLEAYLAAREATATGHINALRREIHAVCYMAAQKTPGVFQLNVPTGGGKTLSSLSFALAHACRHGLQRVIYVIPYTSIIEQTADEFRRVLGAHNVVEHHSNLSEEQDTEFNRFAAENWAAPLIVTTAVQFFETLFSSRNSRCRKLHHMAQSVIIFDEAQTLPSHLLKPCLSAMKTLQRLCGCSLLLCTATQPALIRRKEFDIGWEPEAVQSLIGSEFEQHLAREMRRVVVEELGDLHKEALVEHFCSGNVHSALFIVNLTRQAQDLFELLSASGVAQDGLFHLSARMCASHRREVLQTVYRRLAAGLPVVLVATRVVEAGVDVSFPVVYRDACGLDSLAQAAGRCNRHGEMPMGRVYSYRAADYTLPGTFVDLVDGIAARQDAASEGESLFSPEHIECYFRHFYHKRGQRSNHWDAEQVMELIGSQLKEMKVWNFPEMEHRFRLIPGGQVAVLVPFSPEGEALREHLISLDRLGLMPSREDFRLAQQLSVNVHASEWKLLCPRCECVHKEAGLFMLAEPGVYSLDTGLLREPPEISYIC